jgi:1-deoxy-D-xylulose-5-phosphate reductoisomerase
MMNKALEIIEARWLFDLRSEQIQVMIHPQSVIHSMVEFVDGSVMAQLSPPDMRLPIQYAMTYPDRFDSPARTVDWSKSMDFKLEPPDFDRFPALDLGVKVAKMGGTAGAVLNAANEVAVQAFLDRKLAFHEIVPACREILDQHNYDPLPTLDELFRIDRWAREEFYKWMFA